MRLTFKSNNPFTGEVQYYPDAVYDDKNTGNKMINFNKQTECNNKLGKLEDIEDELGFGLNELIQMLINGIWEVGAVDSKTMLPVSQGITHFYIYGIDFENKKIKVFHKVYKETLFDELDLNKYKQKVLSGWALTKEVE